jgi:predicted adenine nucleotide alpha hydrolase (AANH) superfamily ATPase
MCSAGEPLLLHACCAPCSLEPVRALREEGFAPTIVFVNPNIQPASEYARRLDVVRSWGADQGIRVVEGPCDVETWERDVARWGTNRPARCAACYALRLEGAAQVGDELGLTAVSTTLAVSPYQLFEACGRALDQVAQAHGMRAVWRDFRPLYPQATRRAKELGLYRQNYCGWRFSAAEAALERTEAREARRLARDVERAVKRAGDARA